MKNTLVDLQNHIFEKIEKLGDDALQGEEAKLEIGKAMALSGLAKDAIACATLMARYADKVGYEAHIPILPDTKRMLPPVGVKNE